jgi:accessory gene regulator protein AgrB
MIFIYLSLISILTGLSLWIFGAVLYKKSNLVERKKRKKQRQHAQLIGTIAKVIFIIAALFLVVGVMMLCGVKLTPQ